MKRIASLLLILCCTTLFVSAQTPDQKEMEQQMKEMEARLKEMEARLKQMDQALLEPPPPPLPPGTPQPPRKIIIINGERIDSLPEELDILENLEFNISDSLILGDGMRIYENDDSVVIKMGGLKVKVDEDGEVIKERIIINTDEDDKKKKKKTVESTSGGVRIGLNNMMYKNRLGSTAPDYKHLELITGKSIHVNIGVMGVKVRMVKDNLTLHSGFALDINNYRFRSDSVLKPKTDLVQFYSRSEQGDVTKNKLTTTYVELPVKVQFASGKTGKGAKLGVGFRVAYLIGAHTKVVVNDKKEKVRDDFNLTPFKYGFMAQAGFKWFNVYVNYDVTSLFNSGVQPDLRPVAAGIVLTGW